MNHNGKLILKNHFNHIVFVIYVFSVTQGNDLSYVAKFRATVTSHGTVNWGPGFKWETSCSMDLTYFPYDEHFCRIT